MPGRSSTGRAFLDGVDGLDPAGFGNEGFGHGGKEVGVDENGADDIRLAFFDVPYESGDDAEVFAEAGME